MILQNGVTSMRASASMPYFCGLSDLSSMLLIQLPVLLSQDHLLLLPLGHPSITALSFPRFVHLVTAALIFNIVTLFCSGSLLLYYRYTLSLPVRHYF